MKYFTVFALLLIIFLQNLVMAVDMSNWVDVTSDTGINFTMPPNWAWDPINQRSLWIRTEQSDAVLIISHIPIDPIYQNLSTEDVTTIITQEMGNLSVQQLAELSIELPRVTASGTNLNGMIINTTIIFEGNHSYHWVREYSSPEAVLKHQNTLLAIMNTTIFT